MDVLQLYQRLQSYVGWTDDDARRMARIAARVEACLPELIDDFYRELVRHPDALRVVTGGPAQLARLRASLADWLRQLTEGQYDAAYVAKRWQIGLRHAQIGLGKAYTAAAMARLRSGLMGRLSADLSDPAIADAHGVPPGEAMATLLALNKLLDLDLMLIADAYEAERLWRETEAERQKGERRFRMLVEAAACMVTILRADGTIVYFSPYTAEMTGYASEAVLGANFLELLVPPESRKSVLGAVAETLAGRPARACETAVVRRDGVLRWWVWNGQQLDDYLGEPAVLVVGQDWTERRQDQERLLRAERLAAIGQMIAGLAHESRNALQRIQSCSEMLELEIGDRSEPLRLLRRIQEAQDTLLRLFDDVRGYSAPIQLELARGDVSAAWREAWQSLERERRHRQAVLRERVDGVDLQVEMDRFRLVQVFRNLLENSLAACTDPVEVVVTARETAWGEESALELEVRDNGPGLTPTARQVVFEPFFTTKTKGTGLGMAIAHRIVDAHGGTLAVGAHEGPGAAFVMTLPRAVR